MKPSKSTDIISHRKPQINLSLNRWGRRNQSQYPIIHTYMFFSEESLHIQDKRRSMTRWLRMYGHRGVHRPLWWHLLCFSQFRCCSSALWPMCLPGDKSSSDPIKETSREGGATAMYREGTEDGPVTICMEKPLEEEGPLCPMKRLQDDAA